MNSTFRTCLLPALQRHWPRLLLLALMVNLPAFAAGTNATPDVPTVNRYLLIVETSEPMADRARGVVDVLRGLLGSGMKGQLRAGDTIGLWTYNENLFAGGLSVQHWSPENSQAVMTRILKYLTSQPLEGRARMANVIPALQRIVQSSRFITIVLFSDGSQKISGTPFDEAINDSFKQWRAEQEKNGQPFVTILQARDGVITHYSVTPAPWAVELPPLPPELQVVAKKATAPAATKAPKPAAPAPVGPNLIVIGKKTPPPPPAPTAVESQAQPGSNIIQQSVPARTEPPAPAKSMDYAQGLQTSSDLRGVAPVTGAIEVKAGPVQPIPSEASKAAPEALAPPPLALQAATAHASSETTEPGVALENHGQPPVQVAAAGAPLKKTGLGLVNLLVLAGVLLGAVVLVVALLARRNRRAQPISLITESLDRNK